MTFLTDRVEILRAQAVTLGFIGVDQNEIAGMQIGNTSLDLYLVGYVTSGAVFFTNAINKSTSTTGSYQPRRHNFEYRIRRRQCVLR